MTGAGIITAFGAGCAANAAGFREGRKVFRPVTLFDVSRQRCKIAAEVDLPKELPENRLSNKTRARLNRSSQMLLHAAAEAWTQAQWQPQQNLPLVLGTTGCGAESGENFFRGAALPKPARCQQPTRVLYQQAQRQALDLSEALGFSGPTTMLSNACASGANAIGHAWEMIRSGQTERALAGGYEALGQLVFAGFDALQALSTNPCRPFEATRDGLSLGEGAAIVTLESLESAQKRGANILAEIIGYGVATDTHHLTQPHPQGDAAALAMKDASTRAGIEPSQVAYLNAHGTATPANDGAEAAGIAQWAGLAVENLCVSSTKASIGHTLGAAGAIEALVCIMALREQFLPPQIGDGPLDPACKFKVVREPARAGVEIALSNSFGFGGANASLMFRRWP